MSETNRSVTAAGVLVATWLTCVMLVGTHGEFPLNDDWAYARATENWLRTGSIERGGWTWAPVITNIIIGGIFQRVFGESFEVLRWSTIVVGATGIVGAYCLARELGAEIKSATVAAACVAANPIYFNLSLTFMSDVPFAALSTWAMFGLARSLNRRSWGAAIGGGVATIAAMLSRQPAMAIPVGFGASLLLTTWFRTRTWAIAAVVGVAAIAPISLLGKLLGDARPEQVFTLGYFLTGMLGEDRVSIYQVINAGTCDIIYLGLFLSPLAVAVVRHRTHVVTGTATAVATAACVALYIRRPHPIGINLIRDFGLGPIETSARLPQWTWWCAAVLGAWCGGVGIAAIASDTRRTLDAVRAAALRPGMRAHTLLTMTTGIYLVVMLLAPVPFDRYQVFALAPLGALMASRAGWNTGRSYLGWALVAALGSFAVLGTRDYLEHHRTRWNLLTQLIAEGVSIQSIDGKFEFNGYYHYSNGAANRPVSERRWVYDEEYIISSHPSVEGYEPHKCAEYHRWLPPDTERIYVLRRTPK